MQIQLTRGKVTDVDDADYESGQHPLLAAPWCAVPGRKTWYAVRTDPGTGRLLRLHRYLTGAPPGVKVDHKDTNGLNNRRANLRFGTHVQNSRNRGANANNTTGFKGVTYYKAAGGYVARIMVEGQRIYLGIFETAEEAARAYDAAAKLYFGEFAWLNFPGRRDGGAGGSRGGVPLRMRRQGLGRPGFGPNLDVVRSVQPPRLG